MIVRNLKEGVPDSSLSEKFRPTRRVYVSFPLFQLGGRRGSGPEGDKGKRSLQVEENPVCI